MYYARSAYSEFGFQRVWLKQTLNSKGWEFSWSLNFIGSLPEILTQGLLIGQLSIGGLGVGKTGRAASPHTNKICGTSMVIIYVVLDILIMIIIMIMIIMRICKQSISESECLWQTKHSSGEEDPKEDRLSEHQIRGCNAVSAAGLLGQGSGKRLVCFTDAGMDPKTPTPQHQIEASDWVKAPSFQILSFGCCVQVVVAEVVIVGLGKNSHE